MSKFRHCANSEIVPTWNSSAQKRFSHSVNIVNCFSFPTEFQLPKAIDKSHHSVLASTVPILIWKKQSEIESLSFFSWWKIDLHYHVG